MSLPALRLLPFQLDHAGNTSDLPEIHISTSTPPSKTTTGPLSSCLLKTRPKHHLKKGSSLSISWFVCTMSLPALCRLPFQLDRAGNTSDLPEIPISTSTPPSKTTTGPLSSCLLKTRPKHHLKKGSSLSISWFVCTMSLPALCLLPFQLDRAGNTSDLPEIPISTSTPPSKTTTGPLSSCLLKTRPKHHLKKGSSLSISWFVCTMSLPALYLLPFQLDHAGNTSDFPEIHICTFFSHGICRSLLRQSPPSKTTTTNGSFVNGSTGPIHSNSTGPL